MKLLRFWGSAPGTKPPTSEVLRIRGVFINTLVKGAGQNGGGPKSFELPKGGPKWFQQLMGGSKKFGQIESIMKIKIVAKINRI